QPPKPAAAKTTTTAQPGGKGLPAQTFVHHEPADIVARREREAAAKKAAKPAGQKSAVEKVTGLKLKTGKKAAPAKKAQHGLSEQQRDYMARAGYAVNPDDWEQDWVPPSEDRIHTDLQPSADIKDLNKPGRPLGQAEGTASDPIDVKGNVHEALRQL